ncbi:dermonecrotic toxin domain-containing protein [Pseudomonas sp. 1152_12]|uniref:dermonecrotic toxin domain-containing protein n=1 Tax=Pseudomonas sp. 1152_12 TaxID=2604455 RepID=UPI004064C839
MEVAVAHVLNPQLLDLRARRELPYFLTQAPPKILKPDTLPLIDMQVIAQILDELPASLYLHFQNDLADYWSTLNSHGSSRWQWLSEFLNGQMTAAAAGPSDLTETQRDMLAVTAAWPGRLERLPRSKPTTYAYFIETTLSKAGKEVCLLTPDLLLVRDTQVLLCSVAGAIEPFDCIDAFGAAWGSRMQRQFQCDSITWRRNEPEDNVFEQQAGLILNQQIEDLAIVSFQGPDEVALGRTLEKLTDPALLFTQAPMAPTARLQKVNAQLPAWLKQANADDRFAYHRHLQDMARVIKQNAGQSFNEGIDDIHTFSRDALRKQMQTDHADYDPDDLVLDFAVAAGYPGGSGIIEHVRMSLTELALKNLSGKPKGTLTLSSKSARTLPAWMNEDYLLGSQGLIQRVDLGTAYPQKIKDLLLSDTRDARQRETLFTRELKIQLPMLALEYAIRQQYGVTTTGYRYVKALMGETPTDRVVDGQEIVLRPLGLCRKAGATPDTVNNIFVIEPRDASIGPHLLYRPLYTQALSQYPTRQALLEALATPGALQDSVLTWLPDKARPIYDNGGFKEPHIIRFLPGDEFSIPEKPAPATLAVDEGADEWLQSQVNGKLLSHLFGSTARAMVDLADRESVSNSESRWAIVMEGAWLLFNTLLLPLVRGPAMLVGWFLVLVSSLEQDLAGLDSNDSTTRERALIDLLLNTAMVLLHAASGSDRARPPLAELAPQDSALHVKAWRRTAGLTQQEGTAQIQHGSVALPGEPPATGHTALDFSRSLASPQASAKLLKALLDVHVPWPETLPPPEASGRLKGLYNINNTWHASVGGLLFQVSVVPGFGEVYLVDPQHPLHPGFKLTSDGQGHWKLERKARLEGGMPREKLDKWQRQHRDRIRALKRELDSLQAQALPLALESIPKKEALDAARTQLDEQKKNLREDWLRLGTSVEVPGLHARLAERHEQRQLMTAEARVKWHRAFEDFRQDGEVTVLKMQQIEAKAEELMQVDRTDPAPRISRDRAILCVYEYWGELYDLISEKLSDTLETERGENDTELGNRVNIELPHKVTNAYKTYINTKRQQLEALTQMIEPEEKIETLLHQADPALRKSLLEDRPTDKDISSAATKQHALLVLAQLVLDRTHRSREPAEFSFIRELTDPRTTTSVLAHIEMRTTSGYSIVEQIDVLKGVLERYEQLENAVNALTEMNSGVVRGEYRTAFLEHLVDARASLEAQLADLILADEGIAYQPNFVPPTRSKPATRKVFKTRKKGTLVGDVREPQPQDPGQFADIKDPITGQIVATYLEHAPEGVWVEVELARPVISKPAPAIRSLAAIKRNAETVIADRAGIVRRIRDQQRKLQDPTRREELRPVEWEDMLIQQAGKVKALADELQRDHSTTAGADALITSYLDESQSLTKLAREVCGEGYKQQRPQAAKVAYLLKHGLVDINLAKRRHPLKAGDYIDEYTVRDKSKIKAGKNPEDSILWYAHFHYPAVDTPTLESSFGHLKTKEERLVTRKVLMERARANNREVIYLDKAVIKAPLDQRLFLHLEQPEPRETPTA